MRGKRVQEGLRTLAVVAAAAVAATVSVPATAAAAAPPERPDTAHDLQSTLQEGADDLHELGVTGVQGIASDGHRSVRARSGVRDRETGAPVPYHGYFRMGSNTKTFAAVVTLQLVEEGELSLDDTVAQWLPGVVQGNGHDGTQVTIRQLLQHTSGIHNYTSDVQLLHSPEGYYAHRFDRKEPEELVAMAMAHEPEFPPGTSWSYSNTNYVLAGMIIEKVTGQPWSAAVQQRITRPLGLRHTFSPGAWPFLPRPHATPYHQWTPDGDLHDASIFNPSWAHASGDMVTTSGDLLQFWQAWQSGELLGPGMMAEMQDTVPAEQYQDFLPGARYGLGVMQLSSSCGDYWSHSGDVLGISTVNGITPDGDRATVMSLNTKLADPEAQGAIIDRQLALVDDLLCG